MLPFLVVGLMLVQTKLFAPPATTPEAEMQQKMMKYMMIFMGFMFYKVPSGLGLYFITSSLWAIGERLLLAQDHACPAARRKRAADRARPTVTKSGRKGVINGFGVFGGGKGNGDGNGAKSKPPGPVRPVLGTRSRRGPQGLRPTARSSTSATASRMRKIASATGIGPGPSPGGDRPQRLRRRRSFGLPSRSNKAMPVALDPNDTIAAIASPPGRRCAESFGSRARRRSRRRSTAFSPDDDRTVATGGRARMFSGSMRVDGLRPLLPVMLALWPAPRTYTGQDVAEIHLVGATPLVNLVLAHCLVPRGSPCRAGRVHAPGVSFGPDRSHAGRGGPGRDRSDQPGQLDAALEQLAGGLSGPIVALRDHLLDVVAHLEANLDFTDEHDVDPLGRAALAAELDAGRQADLDRSTGAWPIANAPLAGHARRPGRASQCGQEPAV